VGAVDQEVHAVDFEDAKGNVQAQIQERILRAKDSIAKGELDNGATPWGGTR
jgi:hypothetical protein